MNDECPLVDKIFSATLHILILLSVLCTLFLVVVSKLEKTEFNEKISQVIDSHLPSFLASNDKNRELKAVLSKIDLEKYRKYYEQNPSPTVAITDKWIVIVMIIVNIALLVLLIVTGILSRGCLSLGHILLENVFAFALIGAFEYLFFKAVASRYVPVLPSTFQKTIDETLWSEN